MTRKILSITGTRADYGLMTPVFQSICRSSVLNLELIVTGMHLLPEFETSLSKIRDDDFCPLHFVSMVLAEDSGKAMAQSLGFAIYGIAQIIDANKPDILLLQGDRGEMLAGAMTAAHMNLPIVHMSGGDYSGSIDDSIRNAISKFAHIHLTTCSLSTKRLLEMGETVERIFEVGEPGLDLINNMDFISPMELAREFHLDLFKPIILATQHPVTTEAELGAWQIEQTLEALAELKYQTIFTYPNSDSGGREMVKKLLNYKDKDFIRIIPNLGSAKYLSLMRIASVLVGNSSSGILEAPSFKLPVVNIGSRQYGRLRAGYIIDVDYNKNQIKKAIQYALTDEKYRVGLAVCVNPYGDGNTAAKTVDILQHLAITPTLVAKWVRNETQAFLRE